MVLGEDQLWDNSLNYVHPPVFFSSMSRDAQIKFVVVVVVFVVVVVVVVVVAIILAFVNCYHCLCCRYCWSQSFMFILFLFFIFFFLGELLKSKLLGGKNKGLMSC